MLLLISVVLFCTAAALTVGLHLALAAGAPWGHMTMGGQVKGRLPAQMRLASIVQAFLLGALTLIVVREAGWTSVAFIPTLSWAIWIPVIISALALLANTITPSEPERRFGMPAAAAMLFGSFGVAIFSEAAS